MELDKEVSSRGVLNITNPLKKVEEAQQLNINLKLKEDKNKKETRRLTLTVQ